MVLNGTVGARLHVSFPVLNRSSFGFWFAYFSVISRVVLAMFWFGVQTFVGSECVYQVRSTSRYSLITELILRCSSFPQMLKAIWPSIAHLPNHLPPSANITTVGTFYWTAPKSGQLSRCLFYRNDLLLSVLAHSAPFYVHLTAEDTLAFLGQSDHCATNMVSDAYLGICQSAPKQWYSCTKGEAEW